MYGKLMLPSPSGRYWVKLAMLLVFCCFAESAAASCIRYGHSCWGAHGKRGFQPGPPVRNNLYNMKDVALIGDAPPDTKLFLTRLLQASDNRPFKGRDIFQELKQFQESIDDNQKQNEDISVEDLSSSNESHENFPLTPHENLRLMQYLKNIKSN